MTKKPTYEELEHTVRELTEALSKAVQREPFCEESTDITERRRADKEKKDLEVKLIQAQKMEAIGSLAGGIAHDFNNILGIIIGRTELSLMDVNEETPLYDNLTGVLKASDRAKDLAKQILTFSRQSKQDEEPLAIGIIVKEALKMLRASLPTTIEIRQNIEKDSGLIMANPTQIHQIIMNLSTNAAYAMGEKGGVLDVNISALNMDDPTAAQFQDPKSDAYIKLTVTDTGHGMGSDVVKRIFDPYFTTKGVGEGTGLGLSVVHGIVQSHNGVINVYSKPGKGTTFELFFPRIDLANSKIEVRATENIPTGTEKLLFVDDEPEMVNIYKTMLERLGYSVTARTSSIEALEAFRARSDQYDVIITDQTMPHLTGKMLAKEMMMIRPDIPIILCSGHSDLVSENRAKAMGIRAFLLKPMIMSEIANTIRDVLDRDRDVDTG